MTTRTESGFTLVEALVSLFVFSLVAAGGVAMLMQSVSAQRDVAAAHEALRSLQTTRAFLSADLAQLSTRTPRLDDGGHAAAFTGGAGQLALVRTAHSTNASGAASLVRIAYVLEGDRLLRRLSRDVDNGASESEERVLIENIRSARFGFYDGVTWFETWDAPGASPPKAVALEVSAQRYGDVRIEVFVGVGS